jgi:hypothetical protein
MNAIFCTPLANRRPPAADLDVTDNGKGHPLSRVSSTGEPLEKQTAANCTG